MDTSDDSPEKPNNAQIVQPSRPAINHQATFASLLVHPLAEMLGQELRDFAASQIDQLKRNRRDRNLSSHIQGVRTRLETDPAGQSTASATLKNIKFFQEWSDSVQDVDPEDHLLSDIWEQLFVEMANGRNVEKLLIQKLRQLTSVDAEMLLVFAEKPYWYPLGERRQYFTGRLRRMGIARRSFNPRVLIILITIVILALFFGPVVWWSNWMNISREDEVYEAITKMYKVTRLGPFELVFCISFVSATISALAGYGANHWKLTWIGKDLVAYARKARRLDAESVRRK